MSSEEKAKESIYSFLKETSGIFNRLKKYSILIEQKLPDHKAPVHPANELKSLFFIYTIPQRSMSTQKLIY